MIKTIGYLLFAFMYRIYKIFPMKSGGVMCIMTHDDGPGNNVALVADQLAREGDYTFWKITKGDMMEVKGISDLKKILYFFFVISNQLARAEVVLMDNVFLPYAYIKSRQGTKVIQLWHGTGSIKKFGQHSNQGKLKELERRANENITHLIVSAPGIVSLYAEAFAVDQSKVYPIGLPKTDVLVNYIGSMNKEENKAKSVIYQKYHIPSNQKLILYAPTFRDHQVENPDITKELKELLEYMPEGYVLGLRLHPHVAKNFHLKKQDPRLYQLSFEGDINSLLMATDILVTDYSSIIFEYALLRRPMVFYGYDLSEFSDQGRGFYRNYHEYVPGPVATTGKEVMEYIEKQQWDMEGLDGFVKANFANLDGLSTKRLLQLIKS